MHVESKYALAYFTNKSALVGFIASRGKSSDRGLVAILVSKIKYFSANFGIVHLMPAYASQLADGQQLFKREAERAHCCSYYVQ